MTRGIFFFLLFTVTSTAFCDMQVNPVSEPLLPISLRSTVISSPGKLGFFTAVRGPFSLFDDGRRLVDKAVFWNWMNIGGFGASTLGLIVAHRVDRTVGGMLSLVSVGFWTVSNLATAFAHRDISNEIGLKELDAPRPVTAGVASLAGGLLGAGTLTAISLAFSDSTGGAEIAAYVGFGLSALVGGYGIFKTFEYAKAAGADLKFF